ncbi:MAG: GTP cyclohydrolase II [Actinobacteria bacterium]|nr:GTP cyclohydrolase II [Actinomycetota bacterium]
MTPPLIIDQFTGEWSFLSNYYPVVVRFEGDLYASVEHAYQAAKTTDGQVRRDIRSTLDPDRAKELGRAHLNRPDWDAVKMPVMHELVAAKFSLPFFKERLIATGAAQLVEVNTWGDTFWGVCDGVGENVMGKILMGVRDKVRLTSKDKSYASQATGVSRVVETGLCTRSGEFRAVGYADVNGGEHIALVVGNVAGKEDVLVRVHSECLTGDVLDSVRCDCGEQLEIALRMVGREGLGVVTYLRGHEGRGIGLLAKLQAYRLQDTQRLDTVDANLELGLPVDARDYSVAAGILTDLGVRSIRLLSNNPAKLSGLSACGIAITKRVPLLTRPSTANHRYLAAKRDRLGHQLPHLPEPLDA